MSLWKTHALCIRCWETQEPGRAPVRVKDDDVVPCCRCGRPTAHGIYIRARSDQLKCCGAGPCHDG